jgi:hypothetical protein
LPGARTAPSTQRCIPTGRDNEERLTAGIVELARQHGRYVYRRSRNCCERGRAGPSEISRLQGSDRGDQLVDIIFRGRDVEHIDSGE